MITKSKITYWIKEWYLLITKDLFRYYTFGLDRSNPLCSWYCSSWFFRQPLIADIILIYWEFQKKKSFCNLITWPVHIPMILNFYIIWSKILCFFFFRYRNDLHWKEKSIYILKAFKYWIWVVSYKCCTNLRSFEWELVKLLNNKIITIFFWNTLYIVNYMKYFETP